MQHHKHEMQNVYVVNLYGENIDHAEKKVLNKDFYWGPVHGETGQSWQWFQKLCYWWRF